MKPDHLSSLYYFDEPNFPELFAGIERVWNIIPLLGWYTKNIAGKKGIVIGKGTVVEKGALIKPPVVIGRNCRILSGAYIRDNVLIGDNCIIRSEVKNSLIMDNSSAAHLSYIGDSIIGRNCNLGAGSVLSNFRFDGKNVIADFGNERCDTRLNKLGAIVGDNSSIGCNSVTNPGTFIGRNCLVYPAISIKGFFPSGTVIKK